MSPGSRRWRPLPSSSGHGQVGEDDVGPGLLDQGEQVVAVVGLADDLDRRVASVTARRPKRNMGWSSAMTTRTGLSVLIGPAAGWR